MTGKPILGLLGCGWLGQALLPALHEAYAFQIWVSRSSSAEALQAQGYAAQAWDLNHALPPNLPPLASPGALLISVPPGKLEPYAPALIRALEQLPLMPDTRLIFCSSTGVYGDSPGPWDEQSPLRPNRPGTRAIVEFEQYLQNQNRPWLILRLAGLIGPGRHPGRFLAARHNLPDGDNPVNLISQADAVGLIKRLIHSPLQNQIFNLVDEAHPPRRLFYPAQATALGLEAPSFLPHSGQSALWVKGEKIRHYFPDYAFQGLDL